MPITVTVTNTGNPIEAEGVKAALEAICTHAGENWRVHIIGAQNNTNWEVRISGPNNYQKQYMVLGEEGGHEPEYLASILDAEIRPTPFYETKLAIAELIRQDIPHDSKGIVGGIVRVDGVDIPNEDLAKLYREKKVTREEIREYVKQQGK